MSIDKNIDSEILLAQPRGFCAGVDRAISIVNQALEQFGAPIYVRHEIVHNKYVVDDLRSRGAIFIDDLEKVPKGATLVFSAHGVPPKVKEEVRKYTVETTQANVGIASIKNFIFPLPTIKEQQLIVDELESKLTICDKVEETIKLSLQQAETLRQSILKKAFEGKLITN